MGLAWLQYNPPRLSSIFENEWKSKQKLKETVLKATVLPSFHPEGQRF